METGLLIVPIDGTGVQIAERSLHLQEMGQTISRTWRELLGIMNGNKCIFLREEGEDASNKSGEGILTFFDSAIQPA